MVFKIILKTKNEEYLLDLWIKYYSKLVGKENIIIFDNNSTNPKIWDIYKYHNIEPQNIIIPNNIHFYKYYQDFYNDIFANCDWFTVVDTDEFLCSYKDGIFSVDGVLDILKNSSNSEVLGSIWLSQMPLDNSIEYFKVNTNKHNLYYGKLIIGTSYPQLKDNSIIFCHNAYCKKENGDCNARLDSGLVLLHLDRTNPEFRIQNCIDMVLRATCSNIEHAELTIADEAKQEIHMAVTQLKNGYLDNKDFLDKDYDNVKMSSKHKLREIQLYYKDKDAYLKQFYNTDKNYIRTNIIRNYIYNEPYVQEIVSIDSNFLYSVH